MIRELPRNARYVTLLAWRKENGGEEDEAEEVSEMRRELEERHEMRQWADLNLEIQAMQVNLLQELLRFAPQWKKTPPEMATVGPRHWWPDEQKRKRDREVKRHETKREDKKPSVLDAMRAMGFNPDAH